MKALALRILLAFLESGYNLVAPPDDWRETVNRALNDAGLVQVDLSQVTVQSLTAMLNAELALQLVGSRIHDLRDKGTTSTPDSTP